MQDMIKATIIVMGITAAVNFALDVLVLKVHRRESTGLDWKKFSPSWNRVFVKTLGLLASFGFIAAIYWLFPEYHNGFDKNNGFYGIYGVLLRLILPWWVGLAIPYFYFMDARQREPHDGYYHAGLAAMFRFREVNKKILLQHALGWLVKGFFIALMFTYFTSDLRKFINADFSNLSFDFSQTKNFQKVFDFIYDFIFLADVSIACMGYFMALRIFDTHLRWAEPTVTGWVVAIACYQPFWSFISRWYLDYSRDFAWGAWLEHSPWLYLIWGSAILILYAIYVWATIIFGCRFSNLTHRGILTNGPYRWTKHPAYLSKNTAFWLTFIPFVLTPGAGDSVGTSIRRCAMLLLLNGFYFLRAKTEEAHLSQDPVYVQYKNWMKRNGFFSLFRRK
jgi:protein-S-isoprenylcysteine O-methyltransferase Ste14